MIILYKECKRITLHASFTVEAVFVVPLTIFLILGIIEMSMYMHDYCVVQSIQEEIVSDLVHVNHSGTIINKLVEQDENWLEQHGVFIPVYISNEARRRLYQITEQSLEDKLFFFQYKETKLTMTLQKVHMKTTLETTTGFHILQQLLPSLHLEVVSYGQIHNPSDSIRSQRMLCEEFEQTKIYNKLEELWKE